VECPFPNESMSRAACCSEKSYFLEMLLTEPLGNRAAAPSHLTARERPGIVNAYFADVAQVLL